ncbi:MAG: MlaD family protein [Rickettsiales bacterium]|jgi:phospholipid/cholesterol/gamma-HCH transport system substrate-binding protein|nr:MlaD family protein [Rickettsiales bacterium]
MAKRQGSSFSASAKAFAQRTLGLFSIFAKDKNPLETIAGFAILFIAAYFLVWGMLSARTSTVAGYALTANFASTGGLSRGSDVAVNGVKVGSVSELRLDPNDYTVDVVMSIDSKYRFPADTSAKITSYGIIGDKYLKLDIGSSKEFVAPRGRIKSVPFKSLEEMVGDIIFKE